MMFSSADTATVDSFLSVLEPLLSGCKNLFEADSQGSNILHYLAACRFADDVSERIVKLLSGGDTAVTALNRFGCSPQHCLLFGGSSKVVGVFGGGISVPILGSMTRKEYSVAKNGKLPPICKLIFPNRSSFVVVTEPLGETCLHLVLSSTVPYVTWTGFFTRLASDCVNVPDAKGVYPIHLLFSAQPALSSQPVYSFLRLLQLGADPFVSEKSTGMTIFHMAASNGKQLSLLRMYNLGLIRRDNVAQWCAQDLEGRTPLHHLAMTSLQRSVCVNFSAQLQVLALLCSVAGSEACAVQDKGGRSMHAYLSTPLPEIQHFPKQAHLPADACCHAYIALTEDKDAIKAVWSRCALPSSCDVCKKEFADDGDSRDEQVIALQTAVPSHKRCMVSSYLYVDQSFAIHCTWCKKTAPAEWTAELLPPTQDLAGSANANTEGSEWDVLLAGREQIDEKGWTLWRAAQQIEQVNVPEIFGLFFWSVFFL
jgi:hypothetical protein